MQGGLKRIAVLSVLVVVVVAVAYILGSATGAYLRGREQRKIDNDYIAKRQADTREMAETHGGGFKVGTILPNHLFSDLDGKPVTLGEVLTKKTVLTFISTNCDYCDEEIALISKLAESDDDWKAFVFISGDSTQALRTMRDSADARMRILYDDNFQFSASLFGFVPFPFTMIVNDRGEVEDFMMGRLVEQEIKDILELHRKG